MDANHVLTVDEKHQIEQRVLAQERMRRPNATIRVHIEDKTDSHGKPRIEVIRAELIRPPPPPRKP